MQGLQTRHYSHLMTANNAEAAAGAQFGKSEAIRNGNSRKKQASPSKQAAQAPLAAQGRPSPLRRFLSILPLLPFFLRFLQLLHCKNPRLSVMLLRMLLPGVPSLLHKLLIDLVS